MKHLLTVVFLLSLAGVASAQTSQRVVFTGSNPPTACVPGKVYSNPGLNPAKAWVGTSTGACTPIDPASAGEVAGPASATDKAVARFNGTGGKTIQNSAVTIDDNGSVNIPTGQTYKINNVGLAATDVGAQPLDSDLTTIAGLTATTDNFMVAVSSAWASRTVAQVKTTLALDNVTNTSDANKPVSTAQQTALDLKANLASPNFTIGIGIGVAPTTGNSIKATEGTAPSGASSNDLLYPDSTAHRWKMNNNNAGAVQVVGSGVDVNTSDQVTATHLAAALPVNQGGTGTTSTLTGLMRGSASAMTAAELSGDATTSGSNAVSVVKVNGSTPGGTCTNQFARSLSSSAVPTCATVALASDTSGVLPEASRPLAQGVRAYNSANINVTDSTWTVLTLDSERFDTATYHSTSSNTARLTFATAGTYIISFSGEFSANAIGVRLCGIMLNGNAAHTGTELAQGNATANASIVGRCTITTIYKVSANDYVEAYAFQNSTGTLTMNTSANMSPEFSAVFVGP